MFGVEAYAWLLFCGGFTNSYRLLQNVSHLRKFIYWLRRDIQQCRGGQPHSPTKIWHASVSNQNFSRCHITLSYDSVQIRYMGNARWKTSERPEIRKELRRNRFSLCRGELHFRQLKLVAINVTQLRMSDSRTLILSVLGRSRCPVGSTIRRNVT